MKSGVLSALGAATTSLEPSQGHLDHRGMVSRRTRRPALLRGKVYQPGSRSGDGQRLEDTSTTWQISLPATLGAHPHTGIAVRTQQIQEIFEGEATAKTLQTTWVHNQQGDPVETRRLGEDDAAGDEQIIRQSYIYVSQDYHLWGLEMSLRTRP